MRRAPRLGNRARRRRGRVDEVRHLRRAMTVEIRELLRRNPDRDVRILCRVCPVTDPDLLAVCRCRRMRRLLRRHSRAGHHAHNCKQRGEA